jgi:UDP-N-acetylmuramyl pentapeptide synthase
MGARLAAGEIASRPHGSRECAPVRFVALRRGVAHAQEFVPQAAAARASLVIVERTVMSAMSHNLR